jgi:hypothetical protein
MAFDIQQARKDGKSDDAIAAYLSNKHGFDIDRAKTDGKSMSNIISHLMSKEDVPAEPITEPKGFGEQFLDSSINQLPAIIGTAAPTAAALATGGLSLPWTAALAGGGSMAGEALRQYLTDTPADFPKQVKEGAYGVAGEGMGAAVASVGPSLVAGIKSSLGLSKKAPRQAIPLAARMEAQQVARQAGTSIPASRIGGNFAQALEGVSRAGFGEGAFIAADKQLGTALTKEVKDIVDSSVVNAVTDKEAGDALTLAFSTAESRVKEAVAPFYNKVIPEQGGGVGVYTTSLGAKAQSLLNKSFAKTRSGRSVGLESEDLQLLKDLSDVKTVMSFADAHELRSSLLRQKRALGNKYGADNEFSTLLTNSISTLNKQMDTAATNFNPQLLRAYKAVSLKYGRTMSDLYDDVVVGVLKKNPEKIGETIGRTGNVTEVLKVRKALQRAKIEGINVEPLQENLLNGYLTEITKNLDGSLDNLTGLAEKMTDKKFKRTFDVMTQLKPDIKSNITKILRATNIAAQGSAPTILQGRLGAGGLVNSIGPLMAGSVAYGTGSYAAGAAVIAAQMVVSQILKSPAATNALLAAERIAQKEGLDAAIDFLSKAKPIRRVIGQELARGEVGQDILKPTTDRIDNNIPAN